MDAVGLGRCEGYNCHGKTLALEERRMKKKIVIVNNRLGFYGAENVLINLANHLDLSKYEVTVLTLLQCTTEQLGGNIHYRYVFSN